MNVAFLVFCWLPICGCLCPFPRVFCRWQKCLSACPLSALGPPVFSVLRSFVFFTPVPLVCPLHLHICRTDAKLSRPDLFCRCPAGFSPLRRRVPFIAVFVLNTTRRGRNFGSSITFIHKLRMFGTATLRGRLCSPNCEQRRHHQRGTNHFSGENGIIITLYSLVSNTATGLLSVSALPCSAARRSHRHQPSLRQGRSCR